MSKRRRFTKKHKVSSGVKSSDPVNSCNVVSSSSRRYSEQQLQDELRRLLPEPNTQVSFEEADKTVANLNDSIRSHQQQIEYLKDRLAEAKLRRSELADALADKVRAALRPVS